MQSLNKLNPDDTDDYKSSMCEKFSKLDSSYANIKESASEEKGFGIVALREALEKYNNTERFKVIQRRAGILQENLFRMMTELMNKCPNIGDDNSGSIDRSTALKFIRDFQDEITRRLNGYRDNHKAEMASQKPLSRAMVEYIKENVVPDRYSEFIAEKLELQKKAQNTISSDNTESMNISKIEAEIRNELFSEMYEKDFSEKITSIVSKCHNESTQKITNIFLECLGVSEGTKYYKCIDDASFDREFKNYRGEIIDTLSRSDIYNVLQGETSVRIYSSRSRKQNASSKSCKVHFGLI